MINLTALFYFIPSDEIFHEDVSSVLWPREYRFAWWRDRYVRGAFAQHGDPHRDSPNVLQRHDEERVVKAHPYQFPLTQHNA